MQRADTENWQDHIDPLTRRLLVATGLLQGVILYLLLERLPDTTPHSLQFVFLSLATGLPWMLTAVAQDLRDSRLWLLTGCYGLVLALVAAYTGGQCGNAPPGNCGRGIETPFAFTQALCWCLSTIVVRALLEQRNGVPAYPLLFKYSWHNFFVVLLTSAYLGLFWIVLLLGAWLFRTVEIDLFWKTLGEPWFILPVSGAVIAYGAIVVRQRLAMVTILYRVLHIAIGGLLPMLAFISLCFLMVLPFTGLQPLWNTKISAFILLWLAAFLLFFTNASVQYGSDQSQTVAWRLLIRTALLALPVFLLLAGYSLWLRIDQYGLTPARVWGVIAGLIAGGYAVCYALAIALRRERWTNYLGRINTSMLGVVIAVLVLSNTPFLFIQKIVANNQVERLLSGTTSVNRFDLDYLMRGLGKPGNTALAELVKDARVEALAHSDELAAAIAQSNAETWLQNLPVQDYISLIPEGLQAPEKLSAALRSELQHCMANSCHLLRLPLKQNVVNFVLVTVKYGYISGTVYQETAGQWEVTGHIYADDQGDMDNFIAALENDDIRVVEPEWKNIQIGDTRLLIR